MFKSFKKYIKRKVAWVLSGKLPVKKNKIFFNVFQSDFTCNAKYIALNIIDRNLPVEMVWAVKNKNQIKHHFPKEIKLVRRGSFRYIYEILTSRILIDNAITYFYEELPKSQKQILINTWHGSLGLKRIGKEDNKNKVWVQRAFRCNRETDFIISNSKFESDVYRTTWWEDVPILEYGHPRNDLFFKIDLSIKEKVFKNLNIPLDSKVLLYAPTFRDNEEYLNCDIDADLLRSTLRSKFGGDWIILVRKHFKLSKNAEINRLHEIYRGVIDAGSYPDIQELIAAVDVGLTDYSSWICDFVLTGKPGFLFANDIKKYEDERGFYYPLDSTPFPVADNFEGLINNINSFDEKNYKFKLNIFLKERGCLEDGFASKRVVDKILELLDSNSPGNLSFPNSKLPG